MVAKRKITRLAFKLHGWLGLIAGVFFLLFGLTGSMLMFRKDLDRYFNPRLHHLTPAPEKIPADSIYRMLVQHYPNLNKIVLHDFPADKYGSYEFMLYQNQQHVTDNYLYYVFVNPYNGKIIQGGSYGSIEPSFFRWLYSFHYSLQLGMPGKLFTAGVGLLMLLSLLTGVIVYRKHFWAAVRFKAGLKFKNRQTTISSLHRIIGVWATISTAVLFFTGFWMNRHQFLPAEWNVFPPHQNIIVKANIDQLIKRSKQIVPGFKPIAVNIPCIPGQDILVRGVMPNTTFFLLQGKASSLAFDARTGDFETLTDIDRQPFNKRFDTEVYNLHIGSYGGSAIRWLYVLLGMLPGVLSVTGAMLWFRRKQ